MKKIYIFPVVKLIPLKTNRGKQNILISAKGKPKGAVEVHLISKHSRLAAVSRPNFPPPNRFCVLVLSRGQKNEKICVVGISNAQWMSMRKKKKRHPFWLVDLKGEHFQKTRNWAPLGNWGIPLSPNTLFSSWYDLDPPLKKMYVPWTTDWFSKQY